MNIGFVGLGKLGMPCALAIESLGHRVLGSDPSPNVDYALGARHMLSVEAGADELVKTTNIQNVSVRQLVEQCDIVMVAVQTPHGPQYEGITRLPETVADFDYTYLIKAISELNEEAEKLNITIKVAVISTVLPGTIRNTILPLCSHITLCYNPFFIAMGTAIYDFLNPEFVLIGGDDCGWLCDFYKTLYDKPIKTMNYESAELVKMAYNTFIGMKIVFANTIMEISHKIGANADVVTDALISATNRLISGKYLRGGMGDGGGCHPRDCIAMSKLACKLDTSSDLFFDIMITREYQTEYLAKLIAKEHKQSGLSIIVLGKAFKAESNIVTGSVAVLLQNILVERRIPFQSFDPHVDGSTLQFTEPAIFFIATAHSIFKTVDYPAGSTVIDPCGIIQKSDGVNLVSIGR